MGSGQFFKRNWFQFSINNFMKILSLLKSSLTKKKLRCLHTLQITRRASFKVSFSKAISRLPMYGSRKWNQLIHRVK